MVAAGHDAYLVDWGAPEGADASLGLDRHVTERLLPLLAALPRPPILVGYCLGGSLALGAAALVPTAAIATIAAPWRFSHFPAADLELIASLWSGAKAMCQRIGYVPMEVLQSGFWAMDPARTIRKFALPGRRVAETRDHAGIVLPADEDHYADQKQDDERQFLEQSGGQSVIHRPGIGQRG